MKKLLITLPIFLLSVLLTVSILIYYLFLSPPQRTGQQVTFIINKNSPYSETVSQLKSQGLVRSSVAFTKIWELQQRKEITSGGYYLAPNMNLLQIIDKLGSQTPDLVWLTFPEGLRKEQIGERLAATLKWDQAETLNWNQKYTRTQFEYYEGVYFPDTYLIPVTETGDLIAKRMIDHFNEQFSSYQTQFAQKNILWTTGLKIASLIQRETNNPQDMPLISGIIWNRLEQGVKLDIDATLQYAKGKVGDKWWSMVYSSDKRINSPYNTYINKGLPPTPICNPGLDAISAALNPVPTDCIFYLHDHDGVMHCSKTYAGHLKNIELYLK